MFGQKVRAMGWGHMTMFLKFTTYFLSQRKEVILKIRCLKIYIYIYIYLYINNFASKVKVSKYVRVTTSPN